MIKFKALAMKAETDDMHTIFLLKRNFRSDIIKIILKYPPIAVLEELKKWKVAITLVGQRYKSIESRYDYWTGIGITYGERVISMEIRKFKDNYNKDGKLRCFNCNIYKHIAKDCRKLKKEKEIRKYYKYQNWK